MTKREKVKDSEYEYIREKIESNLDDYDLEKWQEASQSFGPLNYNRTTRKMWYEKNEDKLEAAREIVDFVEGWTDKLRADETLEQLRKGAIRESVVDVVRNAQEEMGISKNRLNVVKSAAFKTLVKFAEQPGRLEEGPYEGKKKPDKFKKKAKRSRRGRKKEKGDFEPPQVDLIHEYELQGKDNVWLTIQVKNDFLHPYQNVEINLELDPNISVKSVEGCNWSPDESRLIVGFVPAELGLEPFTQDIKVNLSLDKKKKKYSISGNLFYDDTDKGYETEKKLPKRTLTI